VCRRIRHPGGVGVLCDDTDTQVAEIHGGRVRYGTVRTRLPSPVVSVFRPAALLPHRDETVAALVQVDHTVRPVDTGVRGSVPLDGK
jgi:hypothetical protein